MLARSLVRVGGWGGGAGGRGKATGSAARRVQVSVLCSLAVGPWAGHESLCLSFQISQVGDTNSPSPMGLLRGK